MAINNTYKELIEKLIEQKDISNLTDSEKALMTTQEFQDALLEYLKEELTYLHHYPIQQSDFSSSGISLFEKLNKYIDLDTNESGDSDGTTNYIDGLGSNDWNESVNELINTLKEKILLQNPEFFAKNPDISGGKIAFFANDVKEANAGYTFGDNTEGPEKNPEDPYVRRYTNIDGEGYEDVRGDDKIESVLDKRNRLQFTHSQNKDNPLSKYIRLLMPMYIRRVEVEDLNRNFWVIGQTITAISAYLFDDDSPIKKMFKYLSSEIVQIWENLIYIWALLKILYEMNKPKEYVAIVDLPNDKWRNYKKFDDFDYTTLTSEEIISRLEYLKKDYPRCNLTIIPVARQSNYEHNYYSKEIYLGVYKYNVSTDETDFKFFGTKGLEIYTDLDIYTIHNTHIEVGKKIIYIKKENENDFFCCSGDKDFQISFENQSYYCALRTIPKIINNNLEIVVEDAIGKALEEASYLQFKYNIDLSSRNFTILDVDGHSGITNYSQNKTKDKISGYYMGELASNRIFVGKIVIPKGSPSRIYLRPIVQNIYWSENDPNSAHPLKENLQYSYGGTNENSLVIDALKSQYERRQSGEDFKFTIYDFSIPAYLVKTSEDVDHLATADLCKNSFKYWNNGTVQTKIGADTNGSPAPSTTLAYKPWDWSNNGQSGLSLKNIFNDKPDQSQDYCYTGSWSGAPSELADNTPRFTQYRNIINVATLLRFPNYSDRDQQTFNCYLSPNYAYTKSMQDCMPILRYGFTLVKTNDGIIIRPLYGRTQKTYKTVVLYLNKADPTKWILKQISTDINFAPMIKTFYEGDTSTGTFKKLDNSNINFPSIYLTGEYPSNQITFDKTKKLRDYNGYNSGFAPIYRVGYDIINYSNGRFHWSISTQGDISKSPSIRKQYASKDSTSSDGYYYDDSNSTIINRNDGNVNIYYYTAESILSDIYTQNIVGSRTTIPTYQVPNIDLRGYEYIYTNNNQGYNAGVFSVPTSNNSETVGRVNFTPNEIFIQHIKDWYTENQSQINNLQIGETISFNLGDIEQGTTLNLGPILNTPLEKKYGAMTEHINVVYFNSENTYKGCCNLRRTTLDGKANLITSNSKYSLKWKKEWQGDISQSAIEKQIEDNYIIGGVAGDFVFNNEEFLDFSKYPSNGISTVSSLEPTYSSIFSAGNGNL